MVHFGLLAMPLGDGLNAPPSNEDIARVIVGALRDPGPHIGRTYRPTGPRLLSPAEIAAIVGEVIGRPVRYQNAPMTLFMKFAKSLGVSAFVLEQLYWFMLDYQRNAFGVGAPTTAVRDVGGSDPEEFDTIVRHELARKGGRDRTVRSWMRATRDLIKAVVTPGPDLGMVAHRLQLP